jgi:hypothetical protein
MILGVSTTKSAVVLAETRGVGKKFAISAIRLIPFQVRSGDDLAELQKTLTAIFAREAKRAKLVVALLKCSSGRFGSGLEPIKAEAITELAAFREGVQLVKVAPQSLKKALGCAIDEKWRDRAALMFNGKGQHRKWTKGMAGAASVAFKVAAG